MEIVIAIAEKIAERAVESVVRSARPAAKIYLQKSLDYLFRYSRNIRSMKIQVEKLQLASDRVRHSVDAAIRNGEKIERDVIKWLEEVGKITENARKFLDGEEETRTKGFNAAFLNLMLRHWLSKKAKKIVKDIGEVLENGSFDRTSYRPAPQGIVLTRCRDYVASESTMSTMKRLMEALKDDNIQVIGVWGMAGVGKSTLVREVANLAKEEKLFDEVAMANVTSSPDLRKIQAEIADMLDLKLDMATVLGRASILWERLSQDRKKPVILDSDERLTKTKDHKKKILVILDDIWETLDLEAIGIPFERCKVLLTSRIRDVFFGMGTQKEFYLEVLLEEEAWSLFEKMAGDCVKDPILRCIATEVARECAGLPLALVTVSKALKNKSSYSWNDALQKLRKPIPEHLTRMQSTIYSPIGLSYLYLESKEVRDVFLLCAQMGDHILERDLLELCYDLGLFHGINTMEDARNRLYEILRILQNCCLLRESHSSSQFLCMHKVVRNAATIIASRDGGDLPLRISHIHGGDHNMHGRDCPLQISDSTNSQISEQLNINGKDQNMYGGDPPLHISHMYGGDHNMYGGDHPLQISDTNSQISKQLKEVVEQSNTNSKIFEQLKEVVEQMKEVGATLKAFNMGPIDPGHLYAEVMKMKEYDEVKLASAFDYLLYNDKAARAFLVKNAKLRKIWLEEFLNNHED